MFSTKVITLQDASERQRIVTENLREHFSFSFSRGYCWRDLQFQINKDKTQILFDDDSLIINEQLFVERTRRNWFRFGEIGNYIAHYVLWKEMVENDLPFMLILEDDCKPTKTFDNSMIDKVIDDIGDSCDVVYLQSISPHNQSKKDMIECFDSDYMRIRHNANLLLEGTASYLITNRGANLLVDDAKQSGWYGPVDNILAKNTGKNGLDLRIPRCIKDYFALDELVGSQEVSQTHAGHFQNRAMIGNLLLQYREGEKVQYA